jgi:hypothetical protein
MLAFGDEALEVLLGLRIGIRPRDAERVEAMLTREVANGRLEIQRLKISVQKSRSAYVSDGRMPGTNSPSSGRNDGRDFTRAYHVFAASSSLHGTSPR